jgi:hypothetical protein
MRSLLALTLVLICLSCLTGCPESQTTVILDNRTPFEVDVELYYDENQNILEDLIDDLGTRMTFTLAANETQTFSLPCEDLQAIRITDADMNILLGVGPEAETGLYHEPDDFTCGDTLTFTFTADQLGTDLDISFSQQE